MAKAEHESALPKVVEIDILSMMLEDRLDPTHLARWDRFAESQPELASTILVKANVEASLLTEKAPTSSLDIQQAMINIVTFSVESIMIAIDRKRLLEAKNDGVVDAVQPPSNGQHADQSVDERDQAPPDSLHYPEDA
jgi:predicted RNase H-like nuclease